MATEKTLCENLRAFHLNKIIKMYESHNDEVLRTASNEIAIPVVDSENNERYIVITVKVPTGSRDGDAYDGYAIAEDYAMKCAERKAKAEEKARKSAERKSKKDK